MFRALRVGRSLKTRGQFFVLIGVLFLGVFAFSIGAVEGTYEGMFERELLRSPGLIDKATSEVGTPTESSLDAGQGSESSGAVGADLSSASPAQNGKEIWAKKGQGKLRLLWVPSWGVDLVHGYLLEPGTSQAPLPPGMPSWLDPGQALVSPALAAHYPIGSVSPFGKVMGLIPESNLSNPTELFFYARPAGSLPASWGFAVDNFAGAGLVINGDTLFVLPKAHAILFLIAFLGLPGVVLCVTGIFQAFSVRESSALLKNLGVSARNRFAFGVGSMATPLIAATVLVGLVFGIALAIPINLPLVGVTLYPPDLLSKLPLMVAVYVVLLGVVVAACGVNAWFALSTEPVKKLRKLMVRVSQILVIPALILVWVFINMRSLHGLVLQIVFFGAVLSLGLAIPTISVWIAELFATLLHKLNPGAVAIVAHRKLRAHSSSIMFSLLGTSLTLVTLGATQLYTSQLAAPMQHALHVKSVLGNQVLELKIPSFTLKEAEDLVKELSPYGGTVIASVPQGETGNVLLQADTGAVSILELSHNDADRINLAGKGQQAALALSIMGADNASLRATLPPDVHLAAIYLVSDKQIDFDRVSKIATSRGAIASPIAYDWLGAVKLLADKLNWFILFGLPAALALILSSLTASNQQAKKRLKLNEIGNLFALSARLRLAVLGLVVFVPAMCCALISYLAYSTLAAGFALRFAGSVLTSPAFQMVLLAAGTVGAIYTSAQIYFDTDGAHRK